MGVKKAQPLIALLLEKFFQLLYHSLAWSYDMVAATVSLGRWNKWIRSIYPMISKSRILEIGFGPGHLQVDLAKTGQSIFGIDESPQMCRLAQKRIKKEGFSGAITRADARLIPFPSSYFNIVVATFPSPYIFQETALREIRRVLCADGKLVVLLAALPMGSSIADRMIHQLFRITGEAPPPEETFSRFEQQGLQYGLQINHHWLNHNADRLLIMTAVPTGPGKGENNQKVA